MEHAGTQTASASSIASKIKGWLPAAGVLVLTPLLALTAVKYIILPPIKQVFGPQTFAGASAGFQMTSGPVYVAKVPVHISGNSSIKGVGIVGESTVFGKVIKHNQQKLEAIASRELAGLKPSSLGNIAYVNAVRGRLTKDFNTAIGAPLIQDSYLHVRWQ